MKKSGFPFSWFLRFRIANAVKLTPVFQQPQRRQETRRSADLTLVNAHFGCKTNYFPQNNK